MKVLVTGATGFLGKHVLAQAASTGAQVRAVSRYAAKTPKLSGIEWVQADLRSRESMADCLDGVDVVIHLAAAKVGDLYTQLAHTVVGTEHLLQAMHEANVRKLVLASSFAIYDYTAIAAHHTLDENTPLEADPPRRDSYAQTKLIQEELVREHARRHDMQVVILRPGAIYGPDNFWTARMGLKLSPSLWMCIGRSTRLPLTHVDNCAAAFWKAASWLEKQHAPVTQIFNVVDDNPPAVTRYANLLRRQSQPSARVFAMPWPVWHAGTAALAWINQRVFGGELRMPSMFQYASSCARFKPLFYDNHRACDVLGWQPRPLLEQSLPAQPLTHNANPQTNFGAAPYGECPT